ncbi:hypothetical protein [Aliiroseovarius sp. YM-037]|uniref:hypothetical protein n=1 Tax=Aliiroseovarius sp. YM-037 TaxID=3341728 RepID=UPI003A8000C8
MITRLSAVFTVLATTTLADAPVVERVEANRSGDEWRFNVTLSHADTGWDDYADGWRVEAEDGTDLGTRVLHHPHVEEQPFTRSLSGVTIPEGTETVYIRARTKPEGWAEDRTEFTLPE